MSTKVSVSEFELMLRGRKISNVHVEQNGDTVFAFENDDIAIVSNTEKAIRSNFNWFVVK